MRIARFLGLGVVGAGALACGGLAAQDLAPAQAPVTPYYVPVDQGALRLGFHDYQAESAQLAQQYVKAKKEDEKAGIRKKLAQALGQQFDQHLKQQQKELEQLEKQIADLRALLTKRREARETIIERRIDQLVQEAEGLGWNTPSGRRPGYWSPSNAFPAPATLTAPRPESPAHQ
jgi:hypothetical protein